MTHHIMALTYAPKIQKVFAGTCRQTIRPYSAAKPKRIGDGFTLHTWEGRPYRSKWGMTLSAKFTDVFMLAITAGNRYVQAMKALPDWNDVYPLSEKWIHINDTEETLLLAGDDQFEGNAGDLMALSGKKISKEIGIYQVLRWGEPRDYLFRSPTDFGIIDSEVCPNCPTPNDANCQNCPRHEDQIGLDVRTGGGLQ